MARRLLQRHQATLTTLGGAVVAVVVMLLYLQLNPPGGRYSDADIQKLADQRIEAITPTPPLEPEIFATVRPSVVTILRDTSPQPNPNRGVGSGVVVDENGSILTAFHVVAGSDIVSVRFFDGTTTTGTVTQRQPDRDLAVVQVRNMPQGAEPATLSGGARQGDRVLAIGSPFGLEGSLSTGVISALNRSFTVEETGQVLQNMIQFDAAANPGNSGGPLVDMNGRVIGIVTGIINPTSNRVFIGIGFAVPIESASGIFAPLG